MTTANRLGSCSHCGRPLAWERRKENRDANGSHWCCKAEIAARKMLPRADGYCPSWQLAGLADLRYRQEQEARR